MTSIRILQHMQSDQQVASPSPRGSSPTFSLEERRAPSYASPHTQSAVDDVSMDDAFPNIDATNEDGMLSPDHAMSLPSPTLIPSNRLTQSFSRRILWFSNSCPRQSISNSSRRRRSIHCSRNAKFIQRISGDHANSSHVRNIRCSPIKCSNIRSLATFTTMSNSDSAIRCRSHCSDPSTRFSR